MTSSQHLSVMVLVLLAPELSPRFRRVLALALIAFQTVCFIGDLKDHP